MTTLVRQTGAAIRILLLLTVLTGIIYPFAVYGIAHLPGLSGNAEGSILNAGGHPIGSALIGTDPIPADPAHDPYFHTRPSASATDPLGPGDPSTSGGSNLAGDSPKLQDQIAQRRAAIAAREGADPTAVPPDAVTASASGLDPDISTAYATLQAPRVARVTGLSPDTVRTLITASTHGRGLGVLGDPGVNVSDLNLAVNQAQQRH
jgi:K+-transporting ATPase ATPase C chain